AIATQHEGEQEQEVEQPSDVEPALPVLNTFEEMQSLVEVIPEQAQQPSHMGYQTARTAVHEALTQRTALLMEVTTGGNDYTAALLPALEWVAASSEDDSSPRRLVIACANQHHARRLVEQVLPRLQSSLMSSVPIVYLAERDGYLCVHRWFGAALRRTSGELTAEQARGLAKLGLWAQQTLTGERSELTMLPQEITAWERIASGVERLPLGDKRGETVYDRCVYRRKGYCFVRRAEERVQAATIVVTTHAGLLDDLSASHSLLQTIDHRLILDADLLEDEVSRWSSAELDQTRLIGTLKTLGTELPDGRYQGLLALAAPSLRENGPGGLSTTPTVAKSELDARMRTWFQAVDSACTAVNSLFHSFNALLEEFAQGADGNGREKGRGSSTNRTHGHGGRNQERGDQPLRLAGQVRNFGSWMDVERAWQQTAQRLQEVIDIISEAERVILTAQQSRHRLNKENGVDDSIVSELAVLAQKLLEQKRLGQQAMGLGESDMVYWLRMPPSPPPSVHQMAHQRQTTPPAPSALPAEHFPILYTQLIQTSALLKRLILKENTTTIFAATALAVDNSFSFSRRRFGLEHEACPALSVVADHHEQTLLYLPNDVPEPNMPQYQRHLDEALVQIATALEGQTLVLFSSHAALRSSYGAIKPILEGKGILVLGQGIDGSPRQLWHIFSTQERVVILGTGSFWDSIGEIVSVPTCIVIARLSMPVLNDPPIAARAEQYSDQLHQFTVPIASLRLRRALNKLAWSDTKRNAVVLFDRRVISKEYGATILNTLPRCSQRQDGISHMPETVLDWLTASGSWE
ncbi:MAG: hypothetical protein M3Z24_02040, partial [Chloroflexota bacterium]|nr:hypothetical protein [Chloroflexota bacterium]